MTDDEKEALTAFSSIAELIRHVLYDHQRYKLYAHVYSAHVYKDSFDAYKLAKEAVQFMDVAFDLESKGENKP